MEQLHFKSALEIARLIRERKLSAAEVLEHFLARVAKYNSKLNAIIWLDAERARKRAKAADAAIAKGEVWDSAAYAKQSINVPRAPRSTTSGVHGPA